MLLYLLRHGQTESNVLNQVTGSKESPLTALGREQAETIGRRLCSEGIVVDRLVSSPWFRAIQTAELAFPNVEFTVDERIGETWAGDVAEMNRHDFEKLEPDFFNKFDPDRPFQGGESHSSLNERVLAWLSETASDARNEEKILAVTHMGPISCIIQYIFDIPMSKFPRFKPENCTLTGMTISSSIEKDKCELKFFAFGTLANAVRLL